VNRVSITESKGLISNFLIKYHTDKDANSLFVKFSEICLYIERLEEENRSLEAIIKRGIIE
jgi:hypothetical protein